jgi:hypothetical protein
MKKLLYFTSILLAFLSSSAYTQWSTDPMGNTPICTLDGHQAEPVMASDASGATIIAWSDERFSENIYAQRLDAFGVKQWSTDGIVVCLDTHRRWGPRIAPDGFGGAVIMWYDLRQEQKTELYAQRLDASGNMLWNTDGVLVATHTDVELGFAGIIEDGQGGAVIVWQDSNLNTGSDIFAQRISANGQVLWSSQGIAVCNETNEQIHPSIIPNGQGGAIVSWTGLGSFLSGADIYAQNISGNGQPLWGTGGIAVCDADGDQFYQEICSDNSGGAILAWMDKRNGGSRDIYAQRINADGLPQWNPNGTEVCNALHHQQGIQLIPDGSGGAFLAWSDQRDQCSDVYVQHLDDGGNALWTANGMATCVGNAAQYPLGLVPDKQGGAILAWTEIDDFYHGLYAQRIGADGTLGWVSGSTELADGLESGYSCSIAPGIGGGAVLSWVRLKDFLFSGDIYAQYIGPNGMPGVVGMQQEMQGTSSFVASPNPCNGIFTVKTNTRPLRIMVTDIYGNLVAEERQRNQDYRFDLGNIGSGIYFVTVETRTERTTRKMVVQN